MAGAWFLGIALGFNPVMQQPWIPSAGARAAIRPICMARLPKAFRGGGQSELWEGAIWEGRVCEITVSAVLLILSAAALVCNMPMRVVAPWLQDFGCFVQLTKQGVVKDRGLLHISELASERIEGEAVRSLVESTVGPVGSKVGATGRRHSSWRCSPSLRQRCPPAIGYTQTHAFSSYIPGARPGQFA